MRAALITRRALAQAAGVTLGAIALPAGMTTPATAGTSPTAAAAVAAGQGPDAGLFGLLAQLDEARHVSEVASRAADDAGRTVESLRSAVPGALWWRDADGGFLIAPATGEPDDEVDPKRFYDRGDVEAIRRACSFSRFRRDAMGSTASLDAAEARRQEIITASDAWLAAIRAEEERSGYDAACERCDEATGALLDIEERIHGTPARTLAGLVAKASVELMGAERAELNPVVLDFLREVAAFRVTA